MYGNGLLRLQHKGYQLAIAKKIDCGLVLKEFNITNLFLILLGLAYHKKSEVEETRILVLIINGGV